MALMEFLGQNKINTTSMIAVESDTAGSESLFDRNLNFGYISLGFLGTATTTISISFTAATVISHVIIQNHNLISFSVFYDGTTTNALFATTTNSATSSYISFASVTVSSIQLRMVSSNTTTAEKFVGELIVAERKLVMERNPTINSYEPITVRKQVVHQMPDGGTTVFNIQNKFRGTLSWDYVSEDFRDALMAIYRTGEVFNFLTGPTTTAWNGEIFEVLWMDKFDFKFSSNVKEVGYSGRILLQQTPSV